MRKTKTRPRWKDFMIDIGDTIGGVFVGLSLGSGSEFMLVFGVLMIMTSIYLEYFKKGKEDGEQTS